MLLQETQEICTENDDEDEDVTLQGISHSPETSNAENVIVMRNLDTKQNVISVTHSDGNATSSSGDVSAGAAVDNIYVITVRPTDEEMSSEAISSQDGEGGEMHDAYEFPASLHNVESNVSVETVVHQGVYQESVEIETDHSQ